MISSGNCEPGFLITDNTECETAAASLSLADTAISSTSYEYGRPFGCTYWPAGLKIRSAHINAILYSYFGLVLGRIDADLCKYILNINCSAGFEIYSRPNRADVD